MSAPYRRGPHRSPPIRRLDFVGPLTKGNMSRNLRLKLRGPRRKTKAAFLQRDGDARADNRHRIATLQREAKPLPGQSTDPSWPRHLERLTADEREAVAASRRRNRS